MPERVFRGVLFVFLTLFSVLTVQAQSSPPADLTPRPIWDPAARAAATRFEISRSGRDALLLNRDGSRLLIANRHDTARMWDVSARKLLHTFFAEPEGKLFLAFTPNDSQLFVNSSVTRAVDYRQVRSFPLSQGNQYPLATNPKGTRLLGFKGNTLTLWDLSTGRPLQTFGQVAAASIYNVVALSADGSRVAVADEQRLVQVWDSGSGKLLQRFSSGMDVLNTLSFSPNGSKLLLGGLVTPFWPVDTVAVKVWDLNRQAWAGQYKAPPGVTMVVAMSADGSRILAGHRRDLIPPLWPLIESPSPTEERYWVLMWNTRTGKRSTLVEQVQHTGSSTPVAFSADGSTVAIEVAQDIWVFKP